MITIADLLTPKPCKSRVFEKKLPPLPPPKKKKNGPKLNPPHPQILCPYLLRHADLKLEKIMLFAANIFIKGMFQVLN